MRLVVLFAVAVFTPDPSVMSIWVWVVMTLYAVVGDILKADRLHIERR